MRLFTAVALVSIFIFFNKVFAQNKQMFSEHRVQKLPNEFWWGGLVSQGHLAPFEDSYKTNLYADNASNQAQPLLISNKGRYIWSEKPFAFEVTEDSLFITQAYGEIKSGQQGKSLPEVYNYVKDQYFPASGKMPDPLLFTSPQWNTWIELTYNQNQNDILKYARNILANGFKPGVIMIDDTWQEDYGVWNFHPARFSNPKMMIDSLHDMGFKVMLWICPFVSADSPPYRYLKEKKALLREKINPGDQMFEGGREEPGMIRWWNGASAVLDLTSPEANKWFKDELDRLQNDYGVDGFKFDAGDSNYYPDKFVEHKPVLPNDQTELFGKLGLEYPLNEYRAMWKMGGQPIAERLWDKKHTWEDLRKLVPQIISQGLIGYAFTCPDMIGGGSWKSFLDNTILDQDLVVRSAQCHALMPMMQFSVAPWRILDAKHLDATKKSVKLREKFTPLIMEYMRDAAQTNIPMIRHLEFVFPNMGYEQIKDQFMVGDKLMVAPMLSKGEGSRTVIIPEGRWKDDEGKIFRGPKKIAINVPLDRLPYFERL